MKDFKEIFEKHILNKEINLIKFKPLIRKTLNFIKKEYIKQDSFENDDAIENIVKAIQKYEI